MCRQRATTLIPTSRASRDARVALDTSLRAWDLAASPDLQVIASELVTNAVLHARTPIQLQLCVAAGVVEVAVGDDAPGVPTPRPPRSDLLGDLDRVPLAALDLDARHTDLTVGEAGSVAAGRGLLLVAALADRWGVTLRPGGGKDVWAQLSRAAGWPHQDDCRCAGSTTRSPGGAQVRHNAGPWDAS